MDSDQNNRGIYGQKISPEGERLWTDNGSTFIEISSTNVYPFAASHSDQDMVVFYEEYFDGLNADISAMRISKEGTLLWLNETVELCSVQSEKVHSVAGHFAFWQVKRASAWRMRGAKYPKNLGTILKDSKEFQKREGRGNQKIPSSPTLFQKILNYFKV